MMTTIPPLLLVVVFFLGLIARCLGRIAAAAEDIQERFEHVQPYVCVCGHTLAEHSPRGCARLCPCQRFRFTQENTDAA